MDPKNGGAGVSKARPDPEPESTLTYHPVDEARRIRAREAAAGIPGLEGFALIVAAGPQAGAYWHLDPGEHEAGRNVGATVLLDDITVSRHHAAFRVEAGRLELEDLGSTNGTYVNGKLTDRVELQPGDEVIIGRFRLVVARGT